MSINYGTTDFKRGLEVGLSCGLTVTGDSSTGGGNLKIMSLSSIRVNIRIVKATPVVLEIHE